MNRAESAEEFSQLLASLKVVFDILCSMSSTRLLLWFQTLVNIVSIAGESG